MSYNFYNMQSGVKNDPTENSLHKSYINPNLIRNNFGDLPKLSENLFSLNKEDNSVFVINFFDFSVRTSGYLQAYTIKLWDTGEQLDKTAATGLYKCVVGMRKLGTRVVQDNRDIFLTSYHLLLNKYYLEFSNKDKTISPDLLNINHIYNSWANVCSACLLSDGALDNNTNSHFEKDLHFAVEGAAPGIIWYLNGEISNENLNWQHFVDERLKRYWDRIPKEELNADKFLI